MRGTKPISLKRSYITRKRRLSRLNLYVVMILMKKKRLASAFRFTTPRLIKTGIGDKGKRYSTAESSNVSTVKL